MPWHAREHYLNVEQCEGIRHPAAFQQANRPEQRVHRVIDRETGWYFTPTSIKAVVLQGDKVLLCRNPRDEWELPGGWPDRQDPTLQDTVRREVLEESGLNVDVGRLLTSCLFRVVDDSPVVLVVFQAAVVGDSLPTESAEHSAVTFFPVHDLPASLPGVYRNIIELAINVS